MSENFNLGNVVILFPTSDDVSKAAANATSNTHFGKLPAVKAVKSIFGSFMSLLTCKRLVEQVVYACFGTSYEEVLNKLNKDEFDKYVTVDARVFGDLSEGRYFCTSSGLLYRKCSPMSAVDPIDGLITAFSEEATVFPLS